jgi:DNA-directed RNA polymerase III subunit RPC6
MDEPRDTAMTEAPNGQEAPFGLTAAEWKFYQFVRSSPKVSFIFLNLKKRLDSINTKKGVKFTDRPENMDVQESYLAMNSLLKKVRSRLYCIKAKLLHYTNY